MFITQTKLSPVLYLICSFCLLGYSAAAPPTRADRILVGQPIGNGNPIPLRILPLGDSITWGTLSTDGNGYHQDLLDLLSGTPVQYIGSQSSGNMTNNFNEGPKAILERPLANSLALQTKDIDPVNASQRLGNLLDECLAACPDAVLITAQLTPSTNATATAFINVFNPTITGLAASRVSAEKKVITVDMRSYVNTTE